MAKIEETLILYDMMSPTLERASVGFDNLSYEMQEFQKSAFSTVSSFSSFASAGSSLRSVSSVFDSLTSKAMVFAGSVGGGMSSAFQTAKTEISALGFSALTSLTGSEQSARRLTQSFNFLPRVISFAKSQVAGFSAAIIIGASGGNRALTAMGKVISTVGKGFTSIRRATKGVVPMIQGIGRGIQKIPGFIKAGIDKMNQFKDSTNKSKQSVMEIVGKLYLIQQAFSAISNIAGYFDELSLGAARLNLVNDGSHTLLELQQKIYETAQRTRSEYSDISDMVSKLRLNAGNVFTTDEGALGFTETLMKAYQVSGANQSDIQNSSRQLLQALGSGVLRGDEFNSVMEQAPIIGQLVADEMGIGMESLRGIAAEGEISADVMVRAFANGQEKIDAMFKEMPMTFSGMTTMIKNDATMAFQTISQKFSAMLNSDQMKMITSGISRAFQSIIWVIDTLVIPAIQSAVDFISNNGQQITMMLGILGAAALGAGLVMAVGFLIANWPLLLILAGVALLTTILMELGVTSEQVFTFIGGVIGGFYAFCYNIFALLWNGVASFVEFFVNVWNDPIGSVKKRFADLGVFVLDILTGIASMVDKMLHTDLSSGLADLSGKLYDWGKEQVGDEAFSLERKEYKNLEESIMAGGELGKEFSQKLDGLGLDNVLNTGNGNMASALNNLASNGVSINGGDLDSIGKIKNDVTIDSEELKMMRDMAQEKYIGDRNIYVTNQTTANFGDVHETADVNQILSVLEENVISSYETDLVGVGS